MTDEQDTSGVQGFGRSLRRTREQLGLSVEDIASELRLSNFQIRALEADDWDQLPGMTYARGYLRSYARLLGLDVDQLLAGATTQEIEISRTEPKIGARKSSDARSAEAAGGFPWGRVSAVVLLGVLAAAYWQYRQSGSPLPGTGGAETAATESAAGTQSEPAGSGAGSATGASDVPSMSTAPQRVVFQFTQESWIDVRDARGERLLYRSFKPGRRIEVEGRPPFSVFLGNARAVEVEYMGDTVTPDAMSGRLYARFVLGSPSG